MITCLELSGPVSWSIQNISQSTGCQPIKNLAEFLRWDSWGNVVIETRWLGQGRGDLWAGAQSLSNTLLQRAWETVYPRNSKALLPRLLPVSFLSASTMAVPDLLLCIIPVIGHLCVISRLPIIGNRWKQETRKIARSRCCCRQERVCHDTKRSPRHAMRYTDFIKFCEHTTARAPTPQWEACQQSRANLPIRCKIMAGDTKIPRKKKRRVTLEWGIFYKVPDLRFHV